jgi:hypothetical protein
MSQLNQVSGSGVWMLEGWRLKESTPAEEEETSTIERLLWRQ